jgi:hypothetical protein
VSKLPKKARNAMIAEAAFAIARDRLGVKPRRRRGRRLLLGGVFAALGVGLLVKRDRVKALLPGSEPVAPPPPPPPPAPSNYDVAGPVANTATPVPAPDPVAPQAIDERAEEEAAAAEAANIGGPAPDYAAAAEPGAQAPELDEAERPLAEAGEGESEGQEQTEADLAAAAEPTAPGVSPAEEQLDEAIEAAGNPATGETPEPVRPTEEKPAESEWRTWSGRSINP